MGYYTEYRLQVIDDNLGFIDHEKGISNIVTYDPFMSHCKWYECDDHILEYSIIYPEFTFILNGTGEEPNDRWKSYYKNGKLFTTQAKIIFEEYNELKLK